VGDDLLSVLTRFHREVVLPDMERVVGSVEIRLRDEMQTGFDALAQKLDKLDTEYHMLVAGLKRVEERLEAVEERLDAVEKRFDKMALKAELVELKARVEGLQQQVRVLEERLSS
jgi:predicted  nucleic acid-binding Zn-ribbon protein